MGLIWFLLVGLLAGWLAGKLMSGGGFGLVGNVVLGVIGAVVGGHVLGMLGIRAGGIIGDVLVATLGAAGVLALVRVLKRA
ncbi:MAG: GlsB/YeaQ/YmgE family stress response membrane protein [Acetobacteraceae bacterium]|nr:GlsB/YeaQ/YmgE family stress response membrane protein [Acetobacteraceae bacterium]